MRLAAIYSLWDGEELLVGSMRSIKESIDLFIIVYQKTSNYGEVRNPLEYLDTESINKEFNVLWVEFTPSHAHSERMMGMANETTKRNIGLNTARKNRCSHFVFVDCDEYYFEEDFEFAKKCFIKTNAEGSVVDLYTYFKSPELRQEKIDKFYVPFIHSLSEHTVAGGFYRYPFYVDPTRKVNAEKVIHIPVVQMQHFSWVRSDIHRKVRNSSAKVNIERSNLLNEWETAEEGSVVNGGNKLIKVDDYFGIKKMLYLSPVAGA